jgi:hypothetical protein
MGLRGDMKMETVSGAIQIRDLAAASSEDLGFSTQVIAWSNEGLKISTAEDFRCVGQQQVFIVTLDDGSELYVSASSTLILRRGGAKTPPEFESGESLLPLYLSNDNHGYPVFKNPKSTQLRKLSWLVAEWKLGRALEKGDIVNHIDRNRKNYHPDNLKITQNKAMATKSRKYGIIRVANEAKSLLSECASLSPKLAKLIEKTNHKVVSVEPSVLEEVFTATIIGAGAVAVSGVFLKLPT